MEQRERRRRGERKHTVALNTAINRSNKEKLDAFADAAGISQARALDLILSHLQTDARGCPPWYEGPLAADRVNELPLTRTA